MRGLRDSRQHPRIPLTVDVTVRAASSVFHGRAQQIGGGGMSLVLEGAALEISQPVELSFTLPSGEPVEIAAVVWWTRGEMLGVRFDYSGNSRALVDGWVNRNLDSAAFFAKPI